MRIISGKARGTKLYTLEGTNTRPTLDRVKESIFNIIQGNIENATVLDLFAGSGAIGLEMLSRGAKKAVLCDNSKEAEEIVRNSKANARKTLGELDQQINIKEQQFNDLKKQFDIYKAKMESLLISQSELIKEINKDED